MSGQDLRITSNNDNVATRQLGSTIFDNVLIQFDFQFDAGDVTNNDFLGIWFGNSNGPNMGFKANCGGGSGCNVVLFARTSGTDSGGAFQEITVGTSYSILGYLQKSGNLNVYYRIDLWVNPTASELMRLTGADPADSDASTIASFNTLGTRSVNLDIVDALLVDNLSLSKMPGPGSLALAGLALAGLAAIRRRPARASS